MLRSIMTMTVAMLGDGDFNLDCDEDDGDSPYSDLYEK